MFISHSNLLFLLYLNLLFELRAIEIVLNQYLFFSLQVELEGFKASNYWLYQFKKKNKIVSRKATKMLSMKEVQTAEQVRQTAIDFVNSLKPIIQEVGEGNVYNTDQSGFKHEMSSLRTLEYKGTNDVGISFQRVSAGKHTHTYQPMISATGRFLWPILIVLQESGNEFGPRVIDSVFRHKLALVRCSKSGLITKEIMKDWFNEIFFKNCGDKSLLIVDSLTTYKDQAFYDLDKPQNVQYDMKVIPGGCTGFDQPLDYYAFRIIKNIFRRISDAFKLNSIDCIISQRNMIVRLHIVNSLIYASPRFLGCRRYPWEKIGYVPKTPLTDNFEHPLQYCFNHEVFRNHCAFCSDRTQAFIRCGWCEQYLCLNHLINKETFHFCCETRIDEERENFFREQRRHSDTSSANV